MTRLLLAATSVLVASSALAQQSRLLQPQPQNRFLAQPSTGFQGRQPQIQFAPGAGGRLVTDNGAGLISNNRGGIVGDHGGGFRR